MRILITGAAGFIGQIVAEQLLQDPSHHLILTDIVQPRIPKDAKYPENVQTIRADLVEPKSKKFSGFSLNPG